MDVFLVPVAADRYELYCEEQGGDSAPSADAPKGFVNRAAYRFREQIAEAEREAHRAATAADVPATFPARLKRRSLRWLAESIAEQRLLWRLRRMSDAHLSYPDDVTELQARGLLQRSLRRDWERHRFWLAVDGVFGVVSLAFVVLPGPNVIGYYFLFRIAGHYLSMRGARHGLSETAWTLQPSPPLTRLRSVVGHPASDRAEVVVGVASSLQLEHLATFFERCAT
jgi:hypothetical protein